MIEIIEKPQHKCEKCGCLFSFDKEDFNKQKMFKKSLDYRSLYEYITFVACPICENAFIIESKMEKE